MTVNIVLAIDKGILSDTHAFKTFKSAKDYVKENYPEIWEEPETWEKYSRDFGCSWEHTSGNHDVFIETLQIEDI